MNKKILFLLPLICAGLSGRLSAGTTIDATNHYAYGANIGWVDWRGDTAHGAFIGAAFCTGSIYSANVGWINLGNGSPANGTQYQNNSSTDFGVNIDGSGSLRGYAYGANVGWIAFENLGAPKVDLVSGKMTGSIYSANCGWISLSNAMAYVQSGASAGGGTAPQIAGIARQSNGTMFIYGAGQPNTTYTAYATTNLATMNWVNIGPVTAGALGAIQFYDLNAPNYKQRFYRFSYP